MKLLKPETRRFLGVVFKLLPVALRYRSDRNEIKKNEGKLLNPEKYSRHAIGALNAFVELGPAFIKLGQLLSVRPDVLPQPYIDQFSKLQDEVPAAPFEQVRPLIEEELGPLERIFDAFRQEAVTGASLGQVYKAIYKGDQVVVKVNRPGIQEKIALDTRVLQRLVPLVGRFIDPSLRFSAESVVDQFSDTIEEELDYRKEADNLSLIKKNLKSDKTAIIPEIYPAISTEKVLVLQDVEGMKISDVKALDGDGLDRNKLARRVSRIFFKMLLSQNIFHADPHPGNISVTNDGRIILYDFGMTGRLDPETRIKLIRFYTALVTGDSSKIVDVMLELEVLQPTTNRAVIKRGVELAIADMRGRKVEETEVKALMEVANRTIYQFPFRLPKNLVLYLRMLSILEGVVLHLDPSFRFIHVLGSLLENEGLMEEAYREELREAIRKFGEALDASLVIAPMLKEYLENSELTRPFLSNQPRRAIRGFVPGAMAGVGVSGIVASLFLIGTAYGKVGLGASLLLLIIAIVAAR